MESQQRKQYSSYPLKVFVLVVKVVVFPVFRIGTRCEVINGAKQVEGLHKASGLELHKPQGAQAVGLCSLGTVRTVITGPERGH